MNLTVILMVVLNNIFRYCRYWCTTGVALKEYNDDNANASRINWRTIINVQTTSSAVSSCFECTIQACYSLKTEYSSRAGFDQRTKAGSQKYLSEGSIAILESSNRPDTILGF